MLAELTYRPKSRPDPDALVRQHIGLVRKLAWHVHGRVANALDIEDLMQTGMVALIEAARGYEDRGHAFATYASIRVRGAMVDSLRRQAASTRNAMKRRREVEAARSKFASVHGRQPTEAELARTLGVAADEFAALLREIETVRHESIDELYSDQSMWFADVADLPEEALSRATLATALTDAIARLPEREGMVLQLYFVEELNLEEIGQTLGVGSARVCQIKKAALDKVREMLADYAD